MNNAYRTFLENQISPLLENLTPETRAAFGLMTPQHMLEHLTWVIKSTLRRNGEPEVELTKGQIGFQKFIQNGAYFQHRPSDKTAADLPELRLASLDEAKSKIQEAITRFYSFSDANPDFMVYSPFFGELNLSQLELFNYQHVRYHFWQFGLIESYEAAESAA